MKIKLLTNYSTYTVGTVVECDDETASKLFRDGIAERDGIIETASVEHDAERADLTPRKIRRAIQKPVDSD